MHQAIGGVLPFAIVVAVSPLNIVAAILLLFAPRALAAAGAYLAGFVVGVGAVLVAFDALAGAADLSSSGPSRAAALVRIVLGAALLAAGVAKLRARRRTGAGAGLPSWMNGITGFGPVKAAGTGVAVGALNPKNLAMAAAASLAVGAAHLTAGQAAVVTAVYTALASVGVAAPLVAALVLGDRSTAVLGEWRGWLERNHDVVMAVVYLVFAGVLVGNGISAL